MNEFYSFSVLELIVLGLLAVAFAEQLYHYIRYMFGILKRKHAAKNQKSVSNQVQEGVSVIICARDEANNLRKYLPAVLEQDYPNFEVIVINDGSTDDTQDVLEYFSTIYKNLKITFVPVGAHVLSTKKLGLSLGVKASQYNYLLFTDADCRPESKHWIANMARNFTPTTDFVLGYGAYFEENTCINKLITYDTLFIAMQYLGMAYAHKPYMGVGRNLAYKKDVFMRNNGFAGTLGLRAGDDDLFVNKYATSNNTKIEISPESITWSKPDKSMRMWLAQKKRHLYVSPHYSSKSKFRLTVEPVSRGIFYAAFVLAFVLGNYTTWIAAGSVFLLRYILQLVVINLSAKQFGQRTYGLNIILFDIFLPLVNLYMLTFGRISGRRQYW